MKILFASDHAGFKLKRELLEYVAELGYSIEDMGAFEHDEEDDYPDYVSLAAREVSRKPDELSAIVIGGSGQGEAMVANRFPNVRAAVFYGGADIGRVIRLSREHNDANILSLGARFLTAEDAKQAVKLWLETPFTGEARHARRIKKIENYSYHGG